MFTRYGAREVKFVVIISCSSLSAIVFSALYQKCFYGLLPAGLVLLLAYVGLRFFRDPERIPPEGEEKMVSPADGKVVEVCESENRFIGKGTKIAVFMSLFNVHVNRSPMNGEVVKVEHKEGEFLNAGSADSSQRNESSEMVLKTDFGEIVVKQVAGVVARKIVCGVQPGKKLQRGERFGMIKYGSRLEVYVPIGAKFKTKVKVGERVRAGESIIGEFAK
ncbi:MAG: phosphatidylserine decarboxylase [Planctomycetota bacterium]|nr:phosphatidylserine decarboxylase [Planctomycetota bacterium]